MNNDPQSYFEDLPKKRMGSAMILQDEKGDFLFLKPSYKDYWSFPGGVVEHDESPQAAAIRETEEEIGIRIENPRFLYVNYVSDPEPKGESLQFGFYGGVLSSEQIASITLQYGESSGWKFLSSDEIPRFANKKTIMRLPLILEAIKNNTAFYLEIKS